MPMADEMQLLSGSPKVGPLGREDGAGRSQEDTVEKARDNLTTTDLVNLRKRGVGQPPQHRPR